MKLHDTPGCKKYETISNNQAKKGFFYCKDKDENIHISKCKDCKFKDDMMKDLGKFLSSRLSHKR